MPTLNNTDAARAAPIPTRSIRRHDRRSEEPGGRRSVSAVKNWAGNVTYSTAQILRPRSVDEAQELIAGAELRPATRNAPLVQPRRGFGRSARSRRSTSTASSTSARRRSPSRPGFATATLSSVLHDHGLALANLASLPHISVGGAIATGTHGSGVGNLSLAAAASALELVCADGSLRRLRRGDDDFDGAVVGLGSLGLVARATLDVVPEFELRQYVFDDLPWPAVDANLDEILAGGYSVSLFTSWTERGVDQVWVKTTDELDPRTRLLRRGAGARAAQPGSRGASGELHGATGRPRPVGRAAAALPSRVHARAAATSCSPSTSSRGSTARDALRELRRLAPVVSPLLLISEIRTIAADTLWLSPFYEQDSIAFHFTWKPLGDEVLAVLPRIEAALAPFGARPHWGKLFTIDRISTPSTRSCRPFASFGRGSTAPGKFRNDVRRPLLGDVGEDVRVRPVPAGLALVERVDHLDVVGLELEVEQLEVLLDPRRESSTSGRRCCRAECASAGRSGPPTCRAVPASSTSAGSSSTLPCAIGDQASVAIPCDFPYASTSVFWKYGWSSIWFTAGTTSHSAARRSRCGDLEVRDADRPRTAVRAELLERLPRRDEVAVVERRQRPVDQEQVDVVGSELDRASARMPSARRRARGSRCSACS